MKLFVSWSGERSQAVAHYLRDWISCVIQAVKPWVSTRDIDRGALWFGEISGQLQDSAVGIICLTQQNKNQPWILFEAGALAKGLSSARVCTLLVDLTPADVRDPLAQFNHTSPTKEGMHALVSTLNGALGDAGLESKTLDLAFETYWPQFENEFSRILATTADPVPERPRSQDDLLVEILETVRSTSARVSRLEKGHVPTSVLHRLKKAGGGIGRPCIGDALNGATLGSTLGSGTSFTDEQMLIIDSLMRRSKDSAGDQGDDQALTT